MITNWNQATHRNRDPILRSLRPHLRAGARVLEIGAGSGLHAAHFAYHMPDVIWQPTERPESLTELEDVCGGLGLTNLLPALPLDLLDGAWPSGTYDAVVAINVLHIAPLEGTTALFMEAASLLRPGGVVFVYGPFRYQDRALEPSNQRFDAFLRERDPESGLRVYDEVDALARATGFTVLRDDALPSNNRGITWRFRGLPEYASASPRLSLETARA